MMHTRRNIEFLEEKVGIDVMENSPFQQDKEVNFYEAACFFYSLFVIEDKIDETLLLNEDNKDVTEDHRNVLQDTKKML